MDKLKINRNKLKINRKKSNISMAVCLKVHYFTLFTKIYVYIITETRIKPIKTFH